MVMMESMHVSDDGGTGSDRNDDGNNNNIDNGNS